MANSNHVPKFGNWDNDNVPYTAYFENARKERGGGIMINPNDPMENPEAFNNNNNNTSGSHNHVVDHDAGEVKGSHSHTSHHNTRRHHVRDRRSIQSQSQSQSQSSSFTTTTTTTASERSHNNSDNHKRGMSKAGSVPSSFSSSSHHRRYTSGSHSFNYPTIMNQEGTAIPKFGGWDVSDPKSGEGYTAIFSKIKEEKHIASGHSPNMSNTPPLNNCSNIKNQCEGHSFRLSKYFCCLFSSEGK